MSEPRNQVRPERVTARALSALSLAELEELLLEIEAELDRIRDFNRRMGYASAGDLQRRIVWRRKVKKEIRSRPEGLAAVWIAKQRWEARPMEDDPALGRAARCLAAGDDPQV